MAEGDDGFAADLGRVRHAVDAVGAMHDRALDLGLEEGRVGHAGGQRNAGRAHERLVDAHGGQRLDRGKADERVGRGAVNAAERNDVEVVVFGGLAQCAERVRDDRDALFRHEKPQQTERGRAGVDEDGVAVLNLLRRQTADERFVHGVEAGADGGRHRARGHGRGHAAVDLCNMAAHFQLVQIAADGIFGHAENLAQLVDADGFARDHILLYGVQSADLHFHAAP